MTNQEKEIRDLRAEVKEFQEMIATKRDELKSSEAANLNLNRSRVALYYGFVAERLDLESRIGRIDLRIQALGFEPPSRRSGDKEAA